MIIFKGNTAVNCAGLLDLTAPHTANIIVENNHGINISGKLINAEIYVDPSKLNAFLTEITPHLESLDEDQAAALKIILSELSDPQVDDKSSALSGLFEFGKSVASGVISTIITSFLHP